MIALRIQVATNNNTTLAAFIICKYDLVNIALHDLLIARREGYPDTSREGCREEEGVGIRIIAAS